MDELQDSLDIFRNLYWALNDKRPLTPDSLTALHKAAADIKTIIDFRLSEVPRKQAVALETQREREEMAKAAKIESKANPVANNTAREWFEGWKRDA
jgi:hypothetical protein